MTVQRLHGHFALEFEGVHAAKGISTDALYRTQLDTTIGEATRRSRHHADKPIVPRRRGVE